MIIFNPAFLPLMASDKAQTLIISIVCAIVFICLFSLVALIKTGTRHRRIYQDSEEIIANISELNLENQKSQASNPPLRPSTNTNQLVNVTNLFPPLSDDLTFKQALNSVNLPIRVFAKDLDQFVLAKTELPETKIKRSIALLEGFIDSKKSKTPVSFEDTKLEIFPESLRIVRNSETFTVNFENLFYCRTWIDIQTRAIIISLITYDDQSSPKFQFFSQTDLCQFLDLTFNLKQKSSLQA